MPQPYRPDRPLVIIHDAPRQRPHLAIHIASIAAAWSHVEYLLGYLLAHLLDADAEIGVAIYMSIISGPARNAALDAVAAQRLTADGIEGLTALKRVVKIGQKQRNGVVHGVWTVTDAMPDALVLCSTADAIQSVAKNVALRRKHVRPLNTYSAMRHNEPQYFLYREKDFLAIEADIERAARTIQDFIVHAPIKSSAPGHESVLVTGALQRLHPRPPKDHQK